MLLLDKQPNKKRKVSGSQSQNQYTRPSQTTRRESLGSQTLRSQQQQQEKKNKKASGGDSSSETESESETEPESDREDLLLNTNKKAQAQTREPPPLKGKGKGAVRLPTPDSPAPTRDGGERLPGRIIGLDFPLDDFRTNIASGDLVTKAVEDLAFVIKTIVMEPLSGRRTPEMLSCMRELRKVASEVGLLGICNLRAVCADTESYFAGGRD